MRNQHVSIIINFSLFQDKSLARIKMQNALERLESQKLH